ncbi:MAG: TetR/AcrR family transcriptional regulator [Oscillospiraceae bacterium]|nr:TetR/AcrR family transcriptional regulator [Oscillospiraceae bacterium]
MDKRQQKTRKAIFAAFTKLLDSKRYSAITVQEIIDEANIGRSTFYAHFETKDELLKAFCSEIFQHIFSDDPISDVTETDSGLKIKIRHLLSHLYDSRQEIKSILTCESGELFMVHFKEYLCVLFEKYLYEIKSQAPKEFILKYLSGSFSETVKWWLSEKNKYKPNEIAEYFISFISL